MQVFSVQLPKSAASWNHIGYLGWANPNFLDGTSWCMGYNGKLSDGEMINISGDALSAESGQFPFSARKQSPLRVPRGIAWTKSRMSLQRWDATDCWNMYSRCPDRSKRTANDEISQMNGLNVIAISESLLGDDLIRWSLETTTKNSPTKLLCKITWESIKVFIVSYPVSSSHSIF